MENEGEHIRLLGFEGQVVRYPLDVYLYCWSLGLPNGHSAVVSDTLSAIDHWIPVKLHARIPSPHAKCVTQNEHHHFLPT